MSNVSPILSGAYPLRKPCGEAAGGEVAAPTLGKIDTEKNNRRYDRYYSISIYRKRKADRRTENR